jgi:hypothetical protein
LHRERFLTVGTKARLRSFSRNRSRISLLSARLEPIEPLEPLPHHPLYVDLTKRTLPGLAVVSGTLSGLRQSIRPSGAVANGEDDLLLGVNVSGCSTAHQRDRGLVLRDGTPSLRRATRADSSSGV